jgi:hypothetical protein
MYASQKQFIGSQYASRSSHAQGGRSGLPPVPSLGRRLTPVRASGASSGATQEQVFEALKSMTGTTTALKFGESK